MQNESDVPLRDNRIAKRQSLWLLLALFFVVGWFDAIIGEGSSYFPLFRIFSSILTTIFTLRWVALDAAERQFKLTATWGLLFVFFSIFGIPVYLVKTRGKASLRPLALGLGLMLIYSIAVALGQGIATGLGLGS